MAIGSCWLAVVACSPPRTLEPLAGKALGPHVELVAGEGDSLRVFTVSLDGVRETRAAKTPSPIERLAWAGSEPVLLLEDHRVGVVTARGFELLASPPTSTWAQPKPPAPYTDHFEPTWRVFTRGSEIWLGRCEWGERTAFDFCEAWIDVRLRPGPIVIERENGLLEHVDAVRRLVKPVPPIAPSPAIQVRLVPDTDRPTVTNGTFEDQPRQKLVCTANGKTIEDPAAGAKVVDEYGNGGRSDLVWISTEPPIFQVGNWDGCYAMCPWMITFEGCEPSKRFSNADLVLGPSQVLALYYADPEPGDVRRFHAVILWRGRELGTIPDAKLFAFVPSR